MERIEVIGLNMADIQGLGRRKGLTHMWRGIAYGADLLPKTRLEVVVKDEEVEKVVGAPYEFYLHFDV